MNYFRDPCVDLLRFGQEQKSPASRKAFAQHVVVLAIDLSNRLVDARTLLLARDLLHNQLAALYWSDYIWIFPIQSHNLRDSALGPEGHEHAFADALLGTAIHYRAQLHSSNSEDRYYAQLILRAGVQWFCKRLQYEGIGVFRDTLPILQVGLLNSQLTFPSSAA